MSSPTATAPPDDVLRADRALVEAVLAGAPGAFERLVREYQGLCPFQHLLFQTGFQLSPDGP